MNLRAAIYGLIIVGALVAADRASHATYGKTVETQNDHMHVVQLTPPGSGCSIVFGSLPSQNQMEPGSMKALQLVVWDAAAARQQLLDRGVGLSEWASR